MLANFNGIFQDTLALAAIGACVISLVLLTVCSLCGVWADRRGCAEPAAVLQTAFEEAMAATSRLVA